VNIYGCRNRKYFISKIGRRHWNSNGKYVIFDYGELEKVLSGDCDNDRQPKMAVAVWGPILAFFVILRCRKQLATPLSSSPARHGRKFRICRWDFIAVSPRFRDKRISGFGIHFRLSIIIGIA